MDDDGRPNKKSEHTIGMVLDALSVDELNERITILQAEIVRLQAEVEAKSKSRQAAESVFKF